MPLRTWTRRAGFAVAVACSLLTGCSLEAKMRLNEVQVLGTHNSYHIEPEPALLAALAAFDANLAASLEYTALPLAEQLERGVRQLELDVYSDPEGGRYASRAGLLAIGEDPRSGLAELDAPGLKVLHVQDIDFGTHCLTFRTCLAQLKAWSDESPGHLPILVLVEAKQEAIPDPMSLGFVVPLPFDAPTLDGVDREIRSVFSRSELIVPDDVRGERASLEQAVLEDGWPTLAEARGRFMFALINRGATREAYVTGHAALAERVMFVNAERGTPEAAFFNRDNALTSAQEIRELVRAGYLVRTRADIDTAQARTGDTTLRDAAFASGAQFVSTDYLVADADFGTSYFVTVPGGWLARCNPLTAPGRCREERLNALDHARPEP
jgi:hypothetical protein